VLNFKATIHCVHFCLFYSHSFMQINLQHFENKKATTLM
jgi:hypothetical protein